VVRNWPFGGTTRIGGGCFTIRFIDVLSADLFWKQCIETDH